MQGYIQVGSNILQGATAEVVSVLQRSSTWNELVGNKISWEELAAALDPRTPPDERVMRAAAVVEKVIARRRVARWIPWYPNLPDHEFAQQFYPGYRDHTGHTLQVFLLGVYMFETVAPLRIAVMESLQRAAGTSISAAELFVEWWTLASVWHDTGYPFEADDFLRDAASRQRQLEKISRGLSNNAFFRGMSEVGLAAIPLRKVYKAGRHSDYSFSSVAEILEGKRATSSLNQLWQSLGVGEGFGCVASELDRLTTQCSVGRPGFHDHGTIGSAVLAYLADEAEDFLSNLAESADTLPELKPIVDIWYDFTALSPIVDMAIKAIAYHNFNFNAIDASSRSLVTSGSRDVVGLANHPYAFFLAVADTLQDWDRHHFVPGADHRPAVRADQMLLQGDGKTIRISISGRDHAALAARKLFDGWLDTRAIAGLIQEGAKFSRPDVVRSGSGITLAQDTSSQHERDRLMSLIDSSVVRARHALIESGDDALVQAAAAISDVFRQLNEAKTVLIATHWSEIEHHVSESGLRTTEMQAFALIRPGVKLPYGRVIDEIGDGGFGTVFRVEAGNPGSMREYAFKLFHGQELQKEEKRRLFKRGYDAMIRMAGHPNVVNVHRFSELPYGFYMDFIPGTNLQDGISSLNMHERLSLARTTAATLAFAHSVQVIHRDIKPANVLLNSNRQNEPVLTDFDLAWIDGRTQNTKSSYATLMYGAPEQFDPKLARDARKPGVDVYALGALLYFLVTGQTPPHNWQWTGEHWSFVYEKLEEHIPANAAKVLHDLMRDMTKVDPRMRLQNMDSVLPRLDRALAFAGSESHTVTETEWLQQVAYAVTGVVPEKTESFESRNGGVTWIRAVVRLQSSEITAKFECVMNSDPRFENVSFEGFRRGSLKQIDARIDEFNGDYSANKAVRHGQPAVGSGSMAIEFRQIPRTQTSGKAAGQLLSEIGRIVGG